MITARFAAEILMKSKPDLVRIVEKMGSDEEGAQLLGALLHDLELAEGIYGELSKICGAVRARVYVAICAIEVEASDAGRKGDGGRQEGAIKTTGTLQ